MKRFVLQQLIEWKNREDRKPLILNGARQVGKTWLLHEFAKLEYKKEAYVVCRKNNLARQLFSQDFNVDRILRGLRAMTSVDITPGDTLIILDEIQDIPEALESLKYFKEEVPEYRCGRFTFGDIPSSGCVLSRREGKCHQYISYEL